ncbi:kinase-like domain-containing protein [Cercophora scortea]|uniref:Kinase-like domain-containing protein n=1 Tax=Cercophora scortea TaxID=314031 RepID=A0AAE0IH33_9PEZI|nr:kinase-like domain-containing protein [Cercophora scortea]
MSNNTSDHLPAAPSDLTPDWLGAKLGHKIQSLENTRNIWGTGSKLFYTITYADATAETNRPEHVCIKGVFDPAMIAAQPWTVSLAQREADFFSKIAPALSGTVLFPRGWWAGTSATQGIVIMDDLTTSGCTFAPEVTSYPVALVLNGVEQLASLHARYWGQSEADHPWIWNNYDPAIKFMCGSWDDVVRQPGRHQLLAYLMDGARCNEALDRYFAERNPRFRTLLHGDTHMGNVYFAPDRRVGFLDWSAVHFGSCFHDVVYHMTAMLSVTDRRAHEMEILDRYLETLQRLGGPRFDRGDPEVMVEYRRSFMTNVIWLVCPDGLQSKERVAALCVRAVAAFDDHGVVDVILGQEKPGA